LSLKSGYPASSLENVGSGSGSVEIGMDSTVSFFDPRGV
jgi:hypothetical protein